MSLYLKLLPDWKYFRFVYRECLSQTVHRVSVISSQAQKKRAHCINLKQSTSVLSFGTDCRFKICCPLVTGAHECAVLQYRFTGEKEVDLMSTYVPEAFRSQGVAALLSQVRVMHLRFKKAVVSSHMLDVILYLMFVLQAALDFLVEENLKAHVSCWYMKNYIEDHPLHLYKDLVIIWM